MSLIYDALRNGPSATGPGAPVGRGFAGAPARPARGGQFARSLAVAVVFGASLGMAGWILAADGLADGELNDGFEFGVDWNLLTN
ncbi:hypothetical protein L505_0842, partial [Bordetella bronchiseptica F4563]